MMVSSVSVVSSRARSVILEQGQLTLDGQPIEDEALAGEFLGDLVLGRLVDRGTRP